MKHKNPQQGKRPDPDFDPEDVLRQRMQAVMSAVASGDDSAIAHAEPPSEVAVTPRGLRTAQTDDRSVDTCSQQHYLLTERNGAFVDNRFEWWDKNPPPTGPITTDFECQFSPILATIVGANLEGREFENFNTIRWDDPAVRNGHVNALPGAGFAVRVARPSSDPQLVTRTIHTETGTNQDHTVLVHQDAYDPDVLVGYTVGKHRPSLWIDFDSPQRVVGLEFGYDTVAGVDYVPHAERARLYAYDRNGEPIYDDDDEPLVAHGRLLQSASRIGPNRPTSRIGVRDRSARISSVELRFEANSDPSEHISQPQVIYRIWYEDVPPAATLQDTCGLELNRVAGMDLEPELDGLGPATKRLPFRCDRAVVLVRGCKLTYLDRVARETFEVGFGVYPRTFEVQPGGTITFSPRGDFGNQSSPQRILVYYTVLAWDTTQIDLHASTGDGAWSLSDDDDEAVGVSTSALLSSSNLVAPSTGLWIKFPDPCHSALMDKEAACGPVAGGLAWFRLTYPHQKLEKLRLHLGGSLAGTLSAKRLNDADQTPAWWVRAGMEGDGEESYMADVGGVLLNGKSLVPQPPRELPALVLDTLPHRSSDTDFFFSSREFNESLAWRAGGDVPFLSLGTASVNMSKTLRELDIEVRGDTYNGFTAHWKGGGGVATNDPDDLSFVFVLPSCGAVRRRVGRPAISVQHLRIDQAVLGLDTPPDQFGMIRNTGDAVLSITGVDVLSRRRDEFTFYYLLPGGPWYPEDRFADFLPLRLMPGELLLVGARVRPLAHADIDPPLFAILRFENNARTQDVDMHVNVTTVDADPAGHWQPERLVFRPRAVSNNDVKSALLVSDGGTALVINTIELEDPDLGFSWTRGPAIEGNTLIANVRYDGTDFGVETKLVADTNAGLLELALVAEELDLTPPPIR